jgi:lysophospholipase L1-like esterase
LRLPAPREHSKSEGVIRLAVVGDSCSFLGREPYIQRFADMARRERSQPVETINASCPGYTSLQGLRRLDDVWDWEPDWLVVYFGWNDHWNSLTGRTDAELASLRVFEPWQARLQQFHIYWAMSRIVGGRNRPRNMQARTVRVPLAEYGENLKQIAAAAQQRGCRVVYITAPTAFVEDQLPDWIYPFFGEYYEMSPEEIRAIPAVHRQYNELVRQTAAETGQLVLDLEAIWPPEQSAFRFRRDCIHLTEKGHEDAARALFELWMTSTANSGSSKDSRE